MTTDERRAEDWKEYVKVLADVEQAEKMKELAEEIRQLESGLHARDCELAMRIKLAEQRIIRLENKNRKLKKALKGIEKRIVQGTSNGIPLDLELPSGVYKTER